jgi:mannose-1-phosphate guanylyltransferase
MSNNKIVIGSAPRASRAIGVIMAGGSGTRFWPLSRASCPKQYLPLAPGGKSLIAAAAERFGTVSSGLGSEVPVLIVTGSSQAELAHQHVPQATILIEPIARNTGPCLGLAALYVLSTAGDIPMICVPADHFIADEQRLAQLFEVGVIQAKKEDVVVTIGIQPTSPETGYGYICAGKGADASNSTPQAIGIYPIERFVEKPNREKALEYLHAGCYYWNAGMFIWRPSVLLRAIDEHMPDLAKQLRLIQELWDSSPVDDAAAFARYHELFSAVAPVSIDVGVMEKANNSRVIPGDKLGWTDIGSWDAWYENATNRDRDGNVLSAQTLQSQSTGCGVLSKDKLVALVGVEDIMVVDTGDAILVCKRGNSQAVRNIVDQLSRSGRKELL